MRFAFIVNNYYPFGGLEKNFLRIALACRERGHELDVYTMSWQGERLEGLAVTLLPGRGMTNHARSRSFVGRWQKEVAAANHDLVVGFNRMPGLDLYYAADVCYVLDIARRRSALSRLTPRYRIYSTYERAVFGPGAKTHIMYLSEREKRNYKSAYGTGEERFHYLPPGIEKERIRESVSPAVRREMREELGVGDEEFLLLMIGSDFVRKGVERSIRALAALPPELKNKTTLCVVGKGKSRRYLRLAGKLGVASRLVFAGMRPDAPRYLAAADLLLHPAVSENTGNVILEAMVAGRSVLASGICGYGFHLEEADGGLVLTEPFSQEEMNVRLAGMLAHDKLVAWGERGRRYADRVDLTSRPQTACRIIEELAEAKATGVLS